MMQLYVAFFNLIFDSEVLPDPWLEGVIPPIYKNTGDSKRPENYRPLMILNCFGKLLTSILSARLNVFIDTRTVLVENQANFHADYSMIGHILYCMH